MSDLINDFNDYRSRMNAQIMEADNKILKRIFNLDTNAYADTEATGGLSTGTKELLGLVSSMVLRCDDCIRYHLGKVHEQGYTTQQVFEVFAIANLVGGTIVVPHLRRAVEFWDALQQEANA